MFLSWGGKGVMKAAWSLYHQTVMQARRPAFYTIYEVPDTVNGRFDLLGLHVALVVRRLQVEGRAGIRLGQALFDQMFLDMDRSMRERGVGDLSVPKHMKRLMRGFNGRCLTYAAALDAGDDAALAAALNRNVFAGQAEERQVERLANCAKSCAAWLAAQPFERLRQGQIDFPKELSDEQVDANARVEYGMVA
jgi:cytochrome b pre-mRNA-processing protein 3